MKYSYLFGSIGIFFVIYSAFGMFEPKELSADWRTLAIQDLEKIHQQITDIHPGVLDQDQLCPHFNVWYTQGYDQALKRAEQVSDVHGYEYALRYYLNGYQDRHVALFMKKEACKAIADRAITYRWPGFVISWRNGKFIVSAHTQQQDQFDQLPPLGAQLITGNGISPQELMHQNIFPFYGNAQFEADWIRYTPSLLIDQHNPWAASISECEFLIDDKPVTFPLIWQSVTDETFSLLKKAQECMEYEQHAQLTYFDEDCVWVRIPSFYLNTEEVVAAMNKLLCDLETIRTARIIVLDIRGNGGGADAWGDKIILHLFGTTVYDTVKQKQHGQKFDEHRVSKCFIESTQKHFENSCAPENMKAQWQEMLTNLKQAYNDKKQFSRLIYDEVDMEDRSRAEVQCTTNPVNGTVYLLTDGAVCSASLSFADLCLGVPEIIHIGRPTGGDTVFMDCLFAPTENNNFEVLLPSLIRRKRICRENNQCYVPKHTFTGDMRDTQALQQWVKDLTNKVVS
ncbi:MAG: S41 family peptidase [Candidatus Babeliales bacterium]